jgi:hypothetical protein
MGAGFIISADPKPANPVYKTKESPHRADIFTKKTIIQYGAQYADDQDDKSYRKFLKKVG